MKEAGTWSASISKPPSFALVATTIGPMRASTTTSGANRANRFRRRLPWSDDSRHAKAFVNDIAQSDCWWVAAASSSARDFRTAIRCATLSTPLPGGTVDPPNR
jgi:hypothetical protein